jgi:trigger factor
VKSAVENLNPTRVRLTVEVPFEELTPSLDAAYKRIGAQVNVPGFRKGKVPARLIDQRFGRGVVLQEAVNDAMPRLYTDAVRENDVEALGQPEVEVTEFTDGEALKFTAEIDVRPDITLPDLDSLSVTVDDADVSDEEVDAQIESLRERFGTLKGVDRPVADGDFVSIDLSATADGEPLEDVSAKGLSYQLGSGGLLDGLDEALLGTSAGDTRTFTTSLVGGGYAGRAAEVSVTTASVKERELPELDDEFAMTASEFDTLEELRADLSTRLQQMKLVQQGVDARDKALAALVATMDIPLPEGLVTQEVQIRQSSLDQQLEQAGMTREQYLETEEQTAEDFDNEVEDRARQAIRAQFVLDAIIEQQNVEISQEELTQHLVRRAQRSGMPPEQLAQQLVANNQIQRLVGEVLRGKALAYVLEHVTVTDASGRPVDLEALRGEAPTGASAQATGHGDEGGGTASLAGEAGDSAETGDSGESGESRGDDEVPTAASAVPAADEATAIPGFSAMPTAPAVADEDRTTTG